MSDVALPTLNSIALCAGVGMLDEGVRLGFEHLGYGLRTVAYCEREAFGASQLVALMEAGVLDQAPIWDDLTTFNGYPWRGRVDCITAGFPCQPHSVAGKRAGLEDARWIWPDIARIVGEVRPLIVALENVPGLAATGGLSACLGDLSLLGFDAEWGLLSAASVGASHTRDRLFIVAYARCQYEHLQQRSHGREHSGSSSKLEDAARHERDRPDGESGRRRGVHETGDELAYAVAGGSSRISGPQQVGIAESVHELGDTPGDGRRQRRPELCREPRRSDLTRTGGAMANPKCAEWRSPIEPGGSCSEGRDLQGQASGRAGDGHGVLADSGCKPTGRHQSIAIRECSETSDASDAQQVMADAHGARYEGGGLQ